MQKVLVTGGTGFIGYHVVQRLLGRGYDVHASYVGRKPDTKGVTWHQANLLSGEGVTKLIQTVKPNLLMHLAWYTVPGDYWVSDQNLRWLSASAWLLQSFGQHGGTRAVFAGTCAEYDWTHGVCNEGSTPLLPSTLYGACKQALQVVTTEYSRLRGISTAWGRIFHLYGPREHPERLVASVVRSLLRTEPAVCGSGTQVRDLLYVQDVAAAFVALLESATTGPVNVGSGQPIPLHEPIRRIGELLGRPELVRFGARPDPIGDPQVLVPDVTRLRCELGWRPEVDLDDGLRRTIEYWKQA